MTNDVSGSEPSLDRLREDPVQGLAELFEHYRPRLRRMVQLRLDPRLARRVDASDVLQEAYDAQQNRPERLAWLISV